jgi:hypothetical protein
MHKPTPPNTVILSQIRHLLFKRKKKKYFDSYVKSDTKNGGVDNSATSSSHSEHHNEGTMAMKRSRSDPGSGRCGTTTTPTSQQRNEEGCIPPSISDKNKRQRKRPTMKKSEGRKSQQRIPSEADVFRMGMNATAKAALGKKEQGAGKLGKSRPPRRPHRKQMVSMSTPIEASHHGEGGDAQAPTAALQQDHKCNALAHGFAKT